MTFQTACDFEYSLRMVYFILYVFAGFIACSFAYFLGVKEGRKERRKEV